MALRSLLLCTLLTFSLSFNAISETVNYIVTIKDPKHPGCINFNKSVGIPYAKEVMGKTNNFIWSTIFKQNTPADRKPVNTVHAIITVYKGSPGYAITWDTNKINFSAEHFSYLRDIKWEFTSLLHQEMTHIFQWKGAGKSPKWLLEGIADYTRLKANYRPDGFAKPGGGSKWDYGYDITARFLEYCDGLVPGFVAKLNNLMRYTYDEIFFKNMTGKPVDQLWKEYKAKYAGKKGVEGIQI